MASLPRQTGLQGECRQCDYHRHTAEAIRVGVTGIVGVHLEGSHLSTARKDAHDAGMIRPMEADDLTMLLGGARSIPVLKVTVAPEDVSAEQVATLASHGALVHLAIATQTMRLAGGTLRQLRAALRTFSMQ